MIRATVYRTVVPCAMAACLVATACGGSGDDTAPSTTTAAPPPTAAPPTTTAPTTTALASATTEAWTADESFVVCLCTSAAGRHD